MNRELKSPPESKSARAARRSFLKGVGASAAGLWCYKMLEDSHALAASGVLPLKFVGVLGWHGTSEKYWARLATDPGQDGRTAPIGDIRHFHSALRPFSDPANRYGYDFRDKINVFEGFDLGVAFNNTLPGGNAPHAVSALMLTGSGMPEGTTFGQSNYKLFNASLDQHLAEAYGGQQRIRSLTLVVERSTGLAIPSALSVGPAGNIITPMNNPEKIWDMVFKGVLVPNDPTAQAAAEHNRAVGKSILNFAMNDLRRLQGRLAGTERQKLDAHLTVMSDLERRLNGDAPIAQGCTVPERSRYQQSGNYTLPIIDSDNEKLIELHTELLAQALICDITRFATIVLPNSPGNPGGALIPSLPNPPDARVPSPPMLPKAVDADVDFDIPANFHNEIAHRYGVGKLENHQAAAGVSRYYHSKVAKLMRRLEAAQVLDSTVILVVNEGGRGDHKSTNVPIVMAGGGQAFPGKMGRRIVHPDRRAQAGDAPLSLDGKPTANGVTLTSGAVKPRPTSHVPILVEVANAFHRANGKPEISSYGTPVSPDFAWLHQGRQGLV